MEASGIIRVYHAELDRRSVGLALIVFVGIKVERHHEEQTNAFREAVVKLLEVVTAHLVFGESDFLL